jgi:WD40 repeat protein/serine/threonine protein kinase
VKPNSERIQEVLFQAFTKLNPEERQKYLAEACQNEPELRAQVESLLQANEQAGEFLKNTVQLEPDFTFERPGTVIGRYKLLEKIGEGGMGVVYMAEQQEPVRRKVALKIIKAGMDTRQVVARFEAERQALALMDHPNIAKVHDGGATETGRPYFVMELVQGVPITQFCDKNQLSTELRLKLFIPVCQAIQSAHQKGIIHRDLKPTNILVSLNPDGSGSPKVIDFGVAKATSQKLTGKTLFTAHGLMLGTPAYMSPEQAELSPLDVDTRADIYSLGALLYELLTGSTPFPEQRLRSAGYNEMQRIILQEEPERPSTRLSRMRSVTPVGAAANSKSENRKARIGDDLDWIVMKCLEKDRARRYETANALAMDIHRHLNNEPVAARPPSALYRLTKLLRRNKLAVGAGALIVLVLVLGVLVSTWQAIRTTRLQQQAQTNRQVSQRLLYAARMQRAQAAWEQNQVGRVRQLLEETADYPDRGFEWYYWQRQAHRELRALRGHLDGVWAVAFSPDGKRIVTGSKDQTAKVWDALTGKQLLTLTGHHAAIPSVAFSPDGRRILTGSRDATAILWDSATGGRVMSLTGHQGDIWGVAFSHDGLRIATGSSDRTARIWDAESGALLLPLQGHGQDVGDVPFSPDGRRLATGSDDHTARIWDATTGKKLFKLQHPAPVGRVAFSPDGQRLVTGCDDHVARVWDATNGTLLFPLTGHADRVFGVSWSQDGSRIATASADRTARIWDATNGTSLFILKGHEDRVLSVAFSPDGRRVVTASDDQTAKVWDLDTAMESLALKGHSSEVTAAFSNDGERIITASFDQTARVWETLTGKFLFTVTGNNAPVFAAAFSPDDRFIATASGESVRLLDTASSNEMVLPTGHRALIKFLAFSPDGRRLVSASADRTTRVWEMPSRKYLFALVGHTDGVISAAFSADGTRIVTSSNDGTARVWDAFDGRLRLPIPGHRPYAGCDSAHFSPDSRRVLTSSSDGTVQVWDSRTGTNLLSFSGHTGPLYWADYSPDGRRIVTASSDQTAKVWDAVSGEELLTLKGHSDEVLSAAFAPNGRRIVTGSHDQTARIWQSASAEEVAQWQAQEKQTVERLALAARQHAAAAERERTLRLQDPGVVKEWLVLPLTTFTNQTGAAALNEEQVPGEARLRPCAGKWRAIRVQDAFIDFDTINRVNVKRSVAYAAAYIRSEAQQTNLSLKVGSEDEAKIYLNGNEIYRCSEPRNYVQDQDELTNVVLNAGLNVLVLKAVMDLDENTPRDWRCSVRFADPTGRPAKGIRTTITPADAQDPGAISQWLVLAPIHFGGTNGAHALAQQQLPDEAHLHPQAGNPGRAGRGEVVWRDSRLDDYALDFKALAGTTNTDYAVAYAVCYIQSETNQPTLTMTVGSDDQAKVYLNGNEIYRYDQPRAFLPDQDEVSNVELRAGVNTLVFKVVNQRGDWAGSIRFTDADGQPVKRIRVTLTPP